MGAHAAPRQRQPARISVSFATDHNNTRSRDILTAAARIDDSRLPPPPCPLQVLSNAETRARYDAGGAEAVAGEGVDDNAARAMFSVLFGTEEFEPLIGLSPHLESRASAPPPTSPGGAASSADMSAEEIAFRQRRREVECAAFLAAKLQPYVEGVVSAEAFCRDSACPAAAEKQPSRRD